MPASNPSPPGPATGTTSGLLTWLAQTIGGVKTFLAAAVFSAGVQLGLLFNMNGSGASDVVIQAGTTLADGSVVSTAKLLQVGTGIGGTFVEKFYITKAGGITTGAFSTLVGGWTTGNSCTMTSGASLSMSGGGSSTGNVLNLGSSTGDRGVIRNTLGAGAASPTVAAITLEHLNGALDAGDTLISFRDNNVEKFRQYSGGDAELMTTAAGVILRSPDGTRWKLTITNAGVVNVALA
jgi:hypothetical protein